MSTVRLSDSHVRPGQSHAPAVLHAVHSGEHLHLWCEGPRSWSPGSESPADDRRHPRAAGAEWLLSLLARRGIDTSAAAPGEMRLRLPIASSEEPGACLPELSTPLAHALGLGENGHAAARLGTQRSDDRRGVDDGADEDDWEPMGRRPDGNASQADEMTAAFQVPTLRVPAGSVVRLLEEIEDRFSEARDDDSADGLVLADSLRFYAEASRLARHLLAQQRFVPMIVQDADGSLRARWQLWLADSASERKVLSLLGRMPASARCAGDGPDSEAWTVLESFLGAVSDAACRRVMRAEAMHETIGGRSASADPHVALLGGLVGPDDQTPGDAKVRAELVKGVRRWVSSLEDRPPASAWRLLLRLEEPIELSALGDLSTPGDQVRWRLGLHLQHPEATRLTVPAEDVWALPAGAATVHGARIDAPQEALLGELGRAARVYRKLERLLEEPDPIGFDLTTPEAYAFLRESKPVLEEQGFSVEAPAWWDQPSLRLGARMIVESDDVEPGAWPRPGDNAAAGVTRLGLSALVNYRWQIAVGDTALSLDQFQKLAGQHSPLVRLNGRWVEIRAEDIKAAVQFIRENPGGRIEVGRALRMAYASDAGETGVPILGLDATGWVTKVFTDPSGNQSMPMLGTPAGFVGTLRPYQLKGLSWLAFLDRLGLGACLADDMGLGKTVQLLALLAHERLARDAARAAGDEAAAEAAGVGPTLLIVPMSVVANWVHESRRFTPQLKVLVHHGATRLSAGSLFEAAMRSDMVVTTYALAHRDREELGKIAWCRVVLDEAQNIKNPAAKQTRAIHAIEAPRRFALTGTPVENRLGELWSIMDFLNPGYLGSPGEFRRKFSVPIERYHDRHRGAQLRGLVQPFVLRRLKSDPAVISDLPEKLETKEFCYLTPEQAQLYQSCVSDMLAAADNASGIHRRGLVLAGLIRLKQICNHPGQFLKEWGPEDESGGGRGLPTAARSGKCQRIIEMLGEVVAAGDRALVFTQFRQMGHMLSAMLRRALDSEVLFLHGGTPPAKREALIQEFQRGGSPGSGTAPIFVLSLKAGGVGLNLTAANHVFHFDRWWNPAVEAQATDRAYRIGQTRTVHVHKFVVSGTLEERIDQMIEDKTQLADQVIGSGERQLTELSTSQLRELLTLRADAISDDDDDGDGERSAVGLRSLAAGANARAALPAGVPSLEQLLKPGAVTPLNSPDGAEDVETIVSDRSEP